MSEELGTWSRVGDVVDIVRKAHSLGGVKHPRDRSTRGNDARACFFSLHPRDIGGDGCPIDRQPSTHSTV